MSGVCFRVICENSSPKSSTHTIAKYLEKTRPTGCFVFPNLRLGCINFPNISTNVRGSNFQGVREKAGLSKTAVSCRRLGQSPFVGQSPPLGEPFDEYFNLYLWLAFSSQFAPMGGRFVHRIGEELHTTWTILCSPNEDLENETARWACLFEGLCEGS